MDYVFCGNRTGGVEPERDGLQDKVLAEDESDSTSRQLIGAASTM